jgi:O-antigen ligase
VIATVGIAAVVVSPSSTGIKLHSLRVLNSESSGRTGLVNGGIDLFTEKPVIGWGAGNFSKAYRSQQRAGAPAAVSASHTTPVTIAAEQGVIGLAVYILLLVTVLLRALQGARMSTARTTVVAGLVALVVHSCFYAAFFEDPITWVLFALAVALPIPLTLEQRQAERDAKRSAAGQGTDPVPAT